MRLLFQISLIAAVLAFLIAPVSAATLTVCGSGCSYTTLSGAFTDPGIFNCSVNTISITAGYVATESTTIQAPSRHCDVPLTVQTSAVSQLPPQGYRITPSNLPNWPSVLATVTLSYSATNIQIPVIQFGNLGNGNVGYQIAAVDLVGNTVTLNAVAQHISILQNSVSAGPTGMFCADQGNGISNGLGIGPTLNPQPGLPQPLQRFTEYYISSLTAVDAQDVEVQFSATPGGPPITMLTADGINNPAPNANGGVYWQPACSLAVQPRNMVFRGIFFKSPDPNVSGMGTASGNTITATSGTFPSDAAGHLWTHGLLFDGTAYTVTAVNGGGSSVTVTPAVGSVTTSQPWTVYDNYISNIVQVGGQEYSFAGKPANITFEQDFIGGDPSWRDRGVRNSMEIAGVDIKVYDSWLESMYYNDGTEGKCFAVLATQGFWATNNECDSPGAMVLTGGQTGDVPLANSTNLHIVNNYALIPGWMFWTASNANLWNSTTPPTSCYYEAGSGGQFVNQTDPVTISGGSIYTCQPNGTFAVDTGAVYRPGAFRYKSRTEYKDVIGLEESGNIIIGQITGQDTNQSILNLTQTEQSQFNNSGQAYYQYQNVVFEDNWADRVWSGVIVGQTKNDLSFTPVSISNITVLDTSDFEVTTASPYPTNVFQNCACPFFTGIGGTGTIPALNGRFTYTTSLPDNMHIILSVDTTAAQYPASGTYTSGGNVSLTTWPTVQNITMRNNLMTRMGETDLNIFQPGNETFPRPIDFYPAGLGGAVIDHNTSRNATSSSANNSIFFENPYRANGVSFAPFPNNQAQLTNSIVEAATQSFFPDSTITNDCTDTGYGGWFAVASAFTHNLMAGPNAAWPNPGTGCADSPNLKTVAGDSNVGFAGTDQSVITNSALSSSSGYSAAGGCTVMCANDTTDLGADIQQIAMVTSGVLTGAPDWRRLAGLRWDAGSTNAVLNLQGTRSWSVRVYASAARVAANQVAQVSDSCGGCVVDGARRQILVTGLSANTLYYFLATDGIKTLVGTFHTLGAGSGTYPFTVSGSGVRYSTSVTMSSPTSTGNGVVPIGANSIMYVDHGPGTSVTLLAAP